MNNLVPYRDAIVMHMMTPLTGKTVILHAFDRRTNVHGDSKLITSRSPSALTGIKSSRLI